MSIWGAYYVGSKMGESIKREKARQKRYDELMEWEKNYEKEKAEEKRRLEREAIQRKDELIHSSTQLARRHYSELREELKEAMNYDREGFVNAYVNWQLEVSTVSSREVDCAEVLDEYQKGLYDYALELRNNDIRKVASKEFELLKPSLKKQIPKDLFIKEYVDMFVPWDSGDVDTTGKKDYELDESFMKNVIENVKEEMSNNPYIDYENDNSNVDELEKWFNLYERGAISKEEYEAKKEQILNL